MTSRCTASATATANVVMFALATASCSAFLDFDLSGGPGENLATSGEAGARDEAGNPSGGPGEGGARDSGMEEDGAPSNDPVDASDGATGFVFTLPCTPGAANTPICDGFEGRTDANPAIWEAVDNVQSGGAFSIVTSGGAGTANHARFTSAAGANGRFLLGSKPGAALVGNTLWASVDVRLSYTAASYVGSQRRNLIGVYAFAAGDPSYRGFAGVSLTGAGMASEVQPGSGTALTPKTLDNGLNGAWHRVEFELVLSTTTGRLRAWIDGRAQPELAGPTISAGVSQFAFWIAASAQASPPSITADFDNVAVRFGPRP